MSERRGHWYLLTGAILGIGLGVLAAWVVFPIPYTASFPASLRTDFKDEYRYMIAASYAVSGNLGRARARLALLEDKDVIQALGDQSQRMLANNTAPEVVRSLGDLSQALQVEVAPTAQATETPALPQSSPTVADESTSSEVSTLASTTPVTLIDTQTPTLETPPPAGITSTPLPPATLTIAPRPTHTSTFTPGPPFNNIRSSTFCEPSHPGLLQISLEDASGQPAAGVELVITWAGGEEHFFSGLKPELGNGYADFVMSPNIEYALSLSNGSTRVTGLSTQPCTATDGSSYPGGIHLDFKQP